MSQENAHRIAASIKPLLDQIDGEIKADYAHTFRYVALLDYLRSDPRHETRLAWDAHYRRTRVLRQARARIIETACMVIEHLSELPIIVTYHGETVDP